MKNLSGCSHTDNYFKFYNARYVFCSDLIFIFVQDVPAGKETPEPLTPCSLQPMDLKLEI